MILETLHILKEQLTPYLNQGNIKTDVVLDNIALWDTGSDTSDSMKGSMVFTLVKTEEESVLKNSLNYKIVNNKTEYQNPPIYLNLYLLISANCASYSTSLKNISKTIQFFQGKKHFNSTNTVYNRNNVEIDLLERFRFVIELYTPSFEEINNIWGTLGGKQLPSVMYRIQLIEISSNQTLSSSNVITHIEGKLNNLKK